MRVTFLYRPNSEHATKVETYVRDFQHKYDLGTRIELLSVNTRDGAAIASIYDVWAYPTIMVLAHDGSVVKMWQGDNLPLMDEVASHAYAQL